jgi:hypothetical protein
MAITIEAQPPRMTAGYNPVMYYLSSNNVNQLGFRYIVEVYLAGTSTKLFEKRYAPRPIDGFAEINISRDVQSYLSANEPFNVSSQNATNHYLKYDIKFGEEYRVAWSFTDFIFNAGQTGFWQVPNVTPHPFVVGDQISVVLDSPPGDFRDALEGQFSVIAVPSAYWITTSLPWIGSGLALSGKIYYSDNRRSRFPNLTRLNNQIVFNGALDIQAFKNWNFSNYSLDGDGLFLSNQPNNFKITPTQDLFPTFFNDFNTTTKRIYFESDSGDIGYKTVSVGSTVGLTQVNAGTNGMAALTMVVGTLPLIEDSTVWYEYWIANTSGTQLSEKVRVYMNRTCSIEDYEVLFLDRLGSFSSYAFQLRSTEKGTVQRMNYNKKFGDVNTTTNTFNFNTWDSGRTTYHVDLSKDFTLNTNWLTDAESVYFEELLTSGYTFVKIDGQYFACQVQETSFEVQRQKNKNLIRKTITVKLSVDTPINV